MSQVVVYDRPTLTPLTIIDVPDILMDGRFGDVTIDIPAFTDGSRSSIRYDDNDFLEDKIAGKFVRAQLERITLRGCALYFLVIEDERASTFLRNVFQPGTLSAQRRMRIEMGFLAAFAHALGLRAHCPKCDGEHK